MEEIPRISVLIQRAAQEVDKAWIVATPPHAAKVRPLLAGIAFRHNKALDIP
jgi:hypothetical protein